MNELWQSGPRILTFCHYSAILQLAAGGPKEAFTNAKIFTQRLEEGRRLLDMQPRKEAHSGQNKQCEGGQGVRMLGTIVP